MLDVAIVIGLICSAPTCVIIEYMFLARRTGLYGLGNRDYTDYMGPVFCVGRFMELQPHSDVMTHC